MRGVGWREGSKRDFSAAQADSFADERGGERRRLAPVEMTVGSRCLGRQLLQSCWELGDGSEKQIWFRRAQAFFCGEWPEDTDDAHVCAFGHLHIFWGITHVDAMRGLEADTLKGEI